ncbi:MAG: GlsB/YeaQ/YmgE family stress response membrane protein [Actinomycetota bacterium]
MQALIRVPATWNHPTLAAFLIAVAVSGLIIGGLGRLVVPGRQPIGILGTIAAGIVGSILGGLVGRALFGPGYVPGLIISVLGAALVIAMFSRAHRA